MIGIGTVARALLAAIGMLTVPDAATLATLALVLAAVCLAAVLAATAPQLLDAGAPARPYRERTPSALVSQSDPDARGHARPRAPGHAAAAA
jgi:hypothetical protein